MRRNTQPQAIAGALLLAFGVVLLLAQLDIITTDVSDILTTWWPLVIVGVGLAGLVAAPRAWVGSVTIIGVGVVFELSELDVIDSSGWTIAWPLAVMLIGISLITGLGERASDTPHVSSTVFWWGTHIVSTAPAFRSAALTSIMGGIELDLRRAGLAPGAQVHAFSFWGGVEVKVPPTWRVEVSGLPLLGGWDNKTVIPADPQAPVLRVRLTTIMAGAEIRN